MRNKGFIIPDEIVNLVIAVACIAILIGLAVLVYSVFQQKHERDQAQAQLDEITAKVSKLAKDGGELTQLYLNPAKWDLVYYDIKMIGGDNSNFIPRICDYKSCLCICNHKNFEEDSYYQKTNSDNCNKDRVCRNIEAKIKFIKNYENVGFINFVKAPVNINLKNTTQEIVIEVR